MSTPRTTAPEDRRLERRAALLLVLLALLLAGTVGYLMYARGVFEATQRLVLVADDAEGVTVGMDLTFAGVPIGRVRRIELVADGSTRILIDVPKRDARWLRESSVFTLTRGLLGGTNLRAYSGVLEDPPLADGAERRVLVGDATAEIPRMVSDARELLRNLTRLTGQDSALAASLEHVKDASGRLAGPHGALGALFGNEADARRLLATIDRTNALLARLDALTGQAQQQVFGADGVVPELRASLAQVSALLEHTRDSLQRVDAILADAQAVAGAAREASADLGALRAEVEANLRKASRMIDELNRRWPFAREPQLKLP